MIKLGNNKIGKVMLGNDVIGKIYLGNKLVYQSGSTPTSYKIQPVTLTWRHNQYVTIGLDINADGTFRVYKSSGSGVMNNPVICYPQSSTYSADSEITSIPIPQSVGQHSMAITVWWDNASGVHNDHNNHTITFNVVAG